MDRPIKPPFKQENFNPRNKDHKWNKTVPPTVPPTVPLEKPEPFKVQTYDILTTYEHEKKQYPTKTSVVTEQYAIFFKESKEPCEPQKQSLYNILLEPNNYLQVLALLLNKFQNEPNNYPTDNKITKKDFCAIQSKTVAAFGIRIERFKLKLLTTLRLMEKLKGSDSVALKIKRRDILDTLVTTHLIMDPNKLNLENNIPKQIETMITNVRTKLISLEKLIKDVIATLLNFTSNNWDQHPMLNRRIIDALENIAPSTFDGVQKDFHYICFLLASPHPIKMFNNIQSKQFRTYAKEIEYLFRFLIASNVPIQLHMATSDFTTINIPMDLFKTTDQCSNNTFSRIIEALNYFVYDTWFMVYGYYMLR
jgi:hypothetical protein